MALKINAGDDRIGRSVGMGEMMSFSSVMPPSANRCGGNRGERDDEGLTSAGFAIDWLLDSTVVWRRRCLKLRGC